MTFVETGDHKMRLRVKHAVGEKVSEQPIRVDSTLFFFVEPHHSKYRMNLHFYYVEGEIRSFFPVKQ